MIPIESQLRQHVDLKMPGQIVETEILPANKGSLSHPFIRIVNTIPRLNGRQLKHIPDSELKQWGRGADEIWLMGIMKRSPVSKEDALNWKDQYLSAVPDLSDDQVIGSAFAPASWKPDSRVASSEEELKQQVERLHRMGKRVITDVVPNHVAPDNELVTEENILAGMFLYKTDAPLPTERFHKFVGESGKTYYLPWGNDEWRDTVQLNLANNAYQTALKNHVSNLVRLGFDGARFDMAMLPTPQIFLKKWGHLLSSEDRASLENQIKEENSGSVAHQFWYDIINQAKKTAKTHGKDFIAIAESYEEYGQNGNLLKQGFDRVYAHSRYKHVQKLFRIEGEPTPYLTDWIDRHSSEFSHQATYSSNHDEQPVIREFGMRDHEGYRFDKNNPYHVSRGVRTARAVTSLMALLPSAFIFDDLARDGYYGEKEPVQISILPKNNFIDQSSFYDLIYSIKKSNLFQKGKFSVPSLKISGHDIGHSHGEIIPLQYENEAETAVVVINAKDRLGVCQVPVPPDAQAVGVLDIQQQKWLDPQVIDTLRLHGDGYFVKLEPNGVQMIYFLKTTASSPKNDRLN